MTDDDEHKRTLHIRYRNSDEESLVDALQAIDRGERPEPHLENVYYDPADIHRVVRPKNLELLRAIAKNDPESIRETARIVDRDVKQVHTNLEELEDLHLIKFVEKGRSRKPTVWYDSIEVDLPLNDPSPGVAKA